MSVTTKMPDGFEPQNDDEEAAMETIPLEDGECVRVASESAPELKYYYRLADLFLKFEQRGDEVVVRKTNPRGAQYEMSYYGSEKVSPNEAFEFLHGDYEIETTASCVNCSTTYRDDEKQCSCLTHVAKTKSELPDIPTRQPRYVRGGEVFTKPQ